MTPRRAALLVAAVAAVLAGLYLVSRTRRPPAAPSDQPAPAPAPAPLATSDALGVTDHDASDVPRAVAVAAEPVEPPLPAWVRAAIIAVALLAFFAVSLIATKGV